VTAGEGMSPLVATAASTLSRNLPGKLATAERAALEVPKPLVTETGQEAGEVREGAGVEAGEGKDQPVLDTVLPS